MLDGNCHSEFISRGFSFGQYRVDLEWVAALDVNTTIQGDVKKCDDMRLNVQRSTVVTTSIHEGFPKICVN